MSVLAEAISVVVPFQSLDALFPGGALDYGRSCPNDTFCTDGNLVRVGFMHPDDAIHWCLRMLEPHGLGASGDHRSGLVIVDQFYGPTTPGDSIEFAEHPDGYSFVWLAAYEAGEMVAPPDWTVERSRSMARWERDPDYGASALRAITRGDDPSSGPMNHIRWFEDPSKRQGDLGPGMYTSSMSLPRDYQPPSFDAMAKRLRELADESSELSRPLDEVKAFEEKWQQLDESSRSIVERLLEVPVPAEPLVNSDDFFVGDDTNVDDPDEISLETWLRSAVVGGRYAAASEEQRQTIDDLVELLAQHSSPGPATS